MRKGERTRRAIVERSAPVFNTKGYFGTSMSELVLETGLEKGSIYNHFGSKEQLASAAFDFSAELVLGRLEEALDGEGRVLERLIRAVEVHRTLAEDRPIQGGCPILNTAIEADDAQPVLREKVRQAMDRWQDLIVRMIREGIANGELDPEVGPEALATIIISTIEGAVMMSKLYGDTDHVHRAVNHLTWHLSSLARR
ncbi:MAG: TetR/AcrR family transcriptional regulator [Actinomycetota bacterium]|nr:TetR/AcrR family transcriptional regulator [Actinomycetota bacterium]